MANESVILDIQGRAEQYRATLAGLPGWTEDAAKKSADSWVRAQSAALAKTQAGLVAQRAAVGDVTKAWQDAGKQVAALAGGPFATLGQASLELVPKLGAVAGAAGAAGAAVVAIGGAAYALRGIASAALEAEDRLRKAGDASEIPPEAAESLEKYRRYTEDMTRSWDVFVVTAGGKAANVIRGTSWALEEASDAFENVRKAILKTDERVEKVTENSWKAARAIAAIGTVGMSELVLWLERTGEALDEVGEKRESASKIAVDMAQSEADAEDAIRRDAAKRADKLLEDREKAEERAAEKAAALTARELEKKKAAYQRYHDWLNSVRVAALEREAERQADALAEAADQLDEWIAKQEAAQEHLEELRIQSQELETNRQIAVANAAVEALEIVEEKYEDAANKAADSWKAMGGYVEDLTGSISNALINAAEDGTAAQKQAAEDFARFHKAISLVNVVFAGIEAVANAAALPVPFNIPAIAAATIDAAARTASVIATPIPSAFGGRAPKSGASDLVEVHARERVLTSAQNDTFETLLSQLRPLAGLARLADLRPADGDVYLDRVRVGTVLRGRDGGGRRPAGYLPPRR